MYCNTLVCIAEKKAVGLYCKMGVLAWNYIAIQLLYCRLGGLAGWLYRNTAGVYCEV